MNDHRTNGTILFRNIRCKYPCVMSEKRNLPCILEKVQKVLMGQKARKHQTTCEAHRDRAKLRETLS